MFDGFLWIFRIIYWRPGLYQVRPEVGNSAQVEIRDGSYLFGPPEMPATALMQRITEAEWLPPVGMNVEQYFHTTLYEDDVSPALLMMVLSFPELWFY